MAIFNVLRAKKNTDTTYLKGIYLQGQNQVRNIASSQNPASEFRQNGRIGKSRLLEVKMNVYRNTKLDLLLDSSKMKVCLQIWFKLSLKLNLNGKRFKAFARISILDFISASDLDLIDHFTFGFHLLFSDSLPILILRSYIYLNTLNVLWTWILILENKELLNNENVLMVASVICWHQLTSWHRLVSS